VDSVEAAPRFTNHQNPAVGHELRRTG